MDRGLSSHQRSLGGSAPARAALRKASGLTARVLVVDHLGSARSSLAGVLRGAGYDVVLVGSGPAALAALEQEGADVLLTDLYMPEMTGWDLARAIRTRSLTNSRGLPLAIGLYSAVLSAFTREQLSRAQVDFALTKLTDPEAIIQAIERALAWSEIG